MGKLDDDNNNKRRSRISRVVVLILLVWMMMMMSKKKSQLQEESGVGGLDDCGTVTALISTCSSFISYGMPDPVPGTPCCDAMVTLNMIVTTHDDNLVCKCLMALITTYTPNYSAIAALPAFCGVSLGFTITPNTDCTRFWRRLSVESDGDFQIRTDWTIIQTIISLSYCIVLSLACMTPHHEIENLKDEVERKGLRVPDLHRIEFRCFGFPPCCI